MTFQHASSRGLTIEKVKFLLVDLAREEESFRKLIVDSEYDQTSHYARGRAEGLEYARKLISLRARVEDPHAHPDSQ
jgi:hypothetical protein